MMLQASPAFSSFSVDEIEPAMQFYGDTLGLKVTTMEMEGMNLLELQVVGADRILVYPKPDHTPATFTILNFPVEDVEATVQALAERGVQFEHYEGALETDERGISRGPGPKIAWFKDPAGNILSVLERE